jgi:hypothetical protein
VDEARAQRIVIACLANIDNWETRLAALVDAAPPGSKLEALSLLRDVTFAKASLKRLAGIEDDEVR